MSDLLKPAVAPEDAATVMAEPAAPVVDKTADWAGGLTDDGRGFIQNKGWTEPSQMLDSYIALEKMNGTSPDKLLKLPDDQDADGAMNDIYTRLGRPDTAEGYDFGNVTAPVESTLDFSGPFKGWAHEIGLSNKQAAALLDKVNNHVGGLQGQLDESRTAEADSDIAALRKEWGGEFDANIAAGKAYLTKFGVGDEARQSMQEAMGTRAFIEHCAKVGRGLGEAPGPGSDGLDPDAVGSGFGLTPEHARAKIGELQADSDFMGRYMAHGTGSAEFKRMQKLMEIGHPDEA
jgi:hypothetical protein